jgi:ribonucleoside-diphosphate reductase alpha chain
MKVFKRNGRSVNFNPSKITTRLRNMSEGLKVDADAMAVKVISQMADGITTTELDTLCIEIAASMVPTHPNYSSFASRLFVTQLRKSTPDSFSEAVRDIQLSTNVLEDLFFEFVKQNESELNGIIKQDRDFDHDIFGLRTLEKSYLLRKKGDHKNDGPVIERPQYMWLRVAIEVSAYNIKSIRTTYDMLSKGYGTHATPTLFNAGTKLSQLSSCFLLANKGDSIDGLFDTMKDVAHISKLAGGIGLHVHDVRAKGSLIQGTNGKSDGLLPMMKTYNEIARWINQGGKRKGSFAIYVEPWHADIFEFLDLKKNTGKEEMRARDLFYAIWMNDLFMERIQQDGQWSLFCPNVLKKSGIVLQELVGEEFKDGYEYAESLGLAMRTVKARELWEKIGVSQIETGTPYIGYKDRVNLSSNQKNLGVIKSSNLCIEINEYSSPEEQAVCNLASIALNKFVANKKFNWKMFKQVVGQFVRNLDNVIDANYYPTKETKTSNMKHRPVGLGVQGLADVFALMKIPFDSDEAKKLNKQIFEHMYYYALEQSNQLAIERGAYDTFEGSPASLGILQFDMYPEEFVSSTDLDWADLRKKVVYGGLRNSLIIALMPTASTSQILGNNECFEPFTSNLYTRGTLSGTYVVSNKHLVRDLEELDLWDEQMKNELMANNGSVINIGRIPTNIKERYKTAYEISGKTIIDMAADRQRFVCQAQSMNIFMTDVSIQKLTSMHFYGWKKGLKTGMYYLRTKAAVDAIKFTVSKYQEEVKIKPEVKPVDQNDFRAMIEAGKIASKNEDEDCEMCGS